MGIEGNQHIIALLIQFLVSLGIPWLMFGDWNCSVAALRASPLFQQLGGVIVCTTDRRGTCEANGTVSTLDYALVSPGLDKAVWVAELVDNAGIPPHRPVRYHLGCNARAYWQRTAITPAQFPLEAPVRPTPPPPQWPRMEAPVTDGIVGDELREVVTKVARHTITGIENELASAYAIPEGERGF